jgi:hypothetical protein
MRANGRFAAIDLRHVEAQAELADGRLRRVVGQRGLGVEGEAEDRRQAGLPGRQHHAPRDDAGHEAQPRGVLLHIARAPGGVQRAQHEAELRVVRAGELVQLAGTCHFVEHLGKFGRAVDGIGKGLRLHHELGVFDLVERARAIGQLHADLERAVALAGHGRLPLAVCSFRPSMATGLLPARRVGGMAAMAASPEARPSSDTGAITSISGSSPPRRSPVGNRNAAGRWQVGVEQRLVALVRRALVRIDMQHRLHVRPTSSSAPHRSAVSTAHPAGAARCGAT